MSQPAHILVVEDEAHLAHGIRFNLQAEGFRVTTVADGQAALRLVADADDDSPGKIDLVILDLMLPGMSGYAVCESLRDSGHNVPVLILSARTLTEDRTRGFEVGADQYLSKPFDLDELLSRVRGLLTLDRRRREAGSPRWSAVKEFSFADARINFETHEVTVGEKSVRLTPLELKLLQYFIDNQGRVVARHELLENVWDMPGTLSTRAPDQFIRRLRKLFEADPAQPRHFLTVRDAGYRFLADPPEVDRPQEDAATQE